MWTSFDELAARLARDVDAELLARACAKTPTERIVWLEEMQEFAEAARRARDEAARARRDMTSDKITWVDGSDPDLKAASEAARRTFRYFMRELSWECRRIVPANELIAVKAAFSDGEIVEHMWVGDVQFDGYVVRGTLINEPHELATVTQSDAVTLPFVRVSDWMILGSGKVYGAYTVQAVRRKMTDEERAAHDDAWGIEFDDVVHLPYAESDDDERDHPMAANVAGKFATQLEQKPNLVRDRGERGRTLLHDEALAGNAPIVRALLDAGADTNAIDDDGKTPAALADAWGWTRVAALLRSTPN